MREAQELSPVMIDQHRRSTPDHLRCMYVSVYIHTPYISHTLSQCSVPMYISHYISALVWPEHG